MHLVGRLAMCGRNVMKVHASRAALVCTINIISEFPNEPIRHLMALLEIPSFAQDVGLGNACVAL